MHLSCLVAASLAVPFVAAHGGIPGAPKIFGLGPNPIAKLKNRSVFHEHAARVVALHRSPSLAVRQGGADGRCGPAAGGASCDAGYCCSPSGYCGVGSDYCSAPDCLFQYGPGCDANQTPGGSDTSTMARPQIGSVDYGGEGVYSCTVPGTVAITYDDGPYIYTSGVLDQFAAYNAKATFFITGNNIGKRPIDEAGSQWPAIIQRMVAEGHQVASHTWSHQDLRAITSQQRKDQMTKNEMAIRNIIGKYPTYMRPPYSSCDEPSGCWADMRELGYVVSYFDLDTDDYNNETPDLIQNAKNRVNTAVAASNKNTDDFLAIAHDIHQQTAQNLTGYMLDLFQQKGYRMVTMGECLGQPESAWYRTSAGAGLTTYNRAPPAASATVSTPPIVSPTSVSTDGSCGGTSGNTCVGSTFGNCCSQYGYCGSTADHCSPSCQSAFGICGGDSLPSSTSTSAASASSAASSSTAPPATPTGPVSTDGSCAGTAGTICLGSVFGNCCSQYGYCGSSAAFCGTGCQTGFGTCGESLQASVSSSAGSIASSSSGVVASSSSTVSSSASTSAVASSSAVVSSSAAQSTSAAASSVATSSTAVPSSSAQQTSTTRSSSSSVVEAGVSTTRAPTTVATSTIPASSTRTSTATPTPTANVSKDGKCGPRHDKQTCKGAGYGGCCRFDGKCGSGFFACGMGCQGKFGSCWW